MNYESTAIFIKIIDDMLINRKNTKLEELRVEWDLAYIYYTLLGILT